MDRVTILLRTSALAMLALLTSGYPAFGDDAEKAQQSPAEKPGDSPENRPVNTPTLRGPSGLLNLTTTDIGDRHTFTVIFRGEYFSETNFLVTGDDHQRFRGHLLLSYTPWQYAEAFLRFTGAANENLRTDPARIEDQVIFAVGDIAFGGKGQYPILPNLRIGPELGILFLNGVDSVGPDLDATSVHGGLIATYDLQGLVAALPLRAHFNWGYFWDNSEHLQDFASYPLSSLNVEKFSLGINRPRMQLKVGIDALLRQYVGIGLQPILEFNVDLATGGPDEDFRRPQYTAATGPLAAEDLDGRVSTWFTLGLRTNPIAGLIVDIGADLGVTSPAYGFGPPVPPWNFIFGIGYTVDPLARVKKDPPPPPPPVAATGTIRGTVISSSDRQPVVGATVTFAGSKLAPLQTDAEGSFLSPALDAGSANIDVVASGFEPRSVTVDVQANQQTDRVIVVVPTAPRAVAPPPPQADPEVRVQVTGEGDAGLPATLVFSGPTDETLNANAIGVATAKMPPGSYTVEISAPDHLTRRTVIEVPKTGTASLNVALTPKPKKSLVKLTNRGIIIRRSVHFVTGKADLLNDSRQLLDEVAHVMLTDAKDKQFEIQGHTDNRGSQKVNMTLSQDRADTVRNYLVGVGVSPERLIAKGYGPTRPKAPNITARNRARNRRVEFRIIP